MSPLAPAELAGILNPRSIAVIGVSNRESNLGLRFTRALLRHGFPGELAVVNRRGEDVEGIAGYESVGELADAPDLAVLALNADSVEQTVVECAAAGVRAALVFTSGFAEVGGEGAARQQRLVRIAADAGIRLLGPNCVGFANVRAHVCPIASAFGFRASLQAGSLAIVTQSGGVAGLLGERAQDIGIGLSHVLATGNEADISAAEVISFLVEDEHTEHVAVYLEAVREPQRLADALVAAERAGMSVAIFKAGSGTRTSAAAAAHTGAVVGDDASFDALCRQTGACRVHDLDHLFLAPAVMSAAGRAGPRVAVLSTSGGAAVAVADACEREGLELPPLSEATAAAVASAVPGFASPQNPMDISGMFVVDMQQFAASLDALVSAPEFDTVVMVQTVHPPELAERIATLVIEATDPRRLIVLWAAGSQTLDARVQLRDAGFAVSESPTALAVGLRAAAGRGSYEPPVLQLLATTEVGAEEAASATLARLSALSPAVAPMARVHDAAAAGTCASSLGFPVVIKADDPQLAHKTERGGVVSGVADPQAAGTAYAELAAAGLAEDGVLIQAQIAGTRELLLSVKRDPVFGLVLVVGFGGVLTEAIARAAVVLPPLTPAALGDAMRAAGLGAMIGGPRGAAPLDLPALTDLADALMELSKELGAPETVELNPVIIDAHGRPWAVDALLDAGQSEA